MARRRFWEGEWVGVKGSGGGTKFDILGTVLVLNLQWICLRFVVVRWGRMFHFGDMHAAVSKEFYWPLGIAICRGVFDGLRNDSGG